MEPLFIKTLRIVALTVIPLVLWSTNGYCISPEQIFVWVAHQMKIEHVGDIPEVNYISKEELQKVFQEFSHKSYAQMASQLGKDQAREIMDLYLENIVGLFHPETRAIYVGKFLEPCRRQAILAHEFAHYFQNLKSGRIHPDDYGADHMRTFREMEAGQIELKFEKLFCSGEGEPDQTLPLVY